MLKSIGLRSERKVKAARVRRCPYCRKKHQDYGSSQYCADHRLPEFRK